MPESPRLVLFALSQPMVFVVAWLMGRAAQRLLRSRAAVSGATMMVVSVLGMCLGFFIAGWMFSDLELWSPFAILIAFLADVVILAGYSAIVLRFAATEQPPSIAELAAAGESDRLEFKSSARWNLRSQEKDPRMEQVVAKTVAAFANSRGGTLLLGVDDEGRLLGLAVDFATLKQPDPDRFELWLRDLLQTRLGANAATLPHVDFEELPDGAHVCRVRTPPSPRPVYLRSGKGQSAASELWVRVGNSTRMLGLDEAVEYVARQWPPPVTGAVRHRLRSVVHRLGGSDTAR